MDIKVYTSPGCFYCTQLKELFKRANITEYEEKVCSSGDEVRVDYPDAHSFPYVIIDGKEVGGLVQTAQIFLEKGLVSAKK
jgi:glutaredoxin